MTAVAELADGDAIADPVRRARYLLSESARHIDPPTRAKELRTLGRGDLALRVLEGCTKNEFVGVERSLAREALGLECKPPAPPKGLRVAAARIFAGALLFVVRLLTGWRRVEFTAMGKFTRLADLVDRLDPLLRQMKARDARGDTRLTVFFFGGYPNTKMMSLYREHCLFLMCTGRLTRKLGNMTVSALRLAGRLTETTTDYRKINRAFLDYPAVIVFKAADGSALDAEIRQAGIDPQRPIVVFGLRDMAYYRFYGDVMKIPLTKQGRRAETHHRCPQLASYLPFTRYWAERGYQVVRMGLRVSEALPPAHPNIIDYANGPRTDDLDAWLFSSCRFMLAGDTGLFSGAAAFDRPSVLSDLFLIRNTMYSSNKVTRNIFVPKLMFDTREQRLLTFRELIYFNHHFSFAEDCEAEGFRILHNDAEDILAATIELEDRLTGRHVESAQDRELQAAYHSIYPPNHIGYGSTALISAAFLRKHADLLD